MDVDCPIFPISVDLGSVAFVDSPVVWAVGYVRDPSISYTLSGSTASLRPYYTTQYPTTEEALEFFVSDFNNSLTRAISLDTQVRQAASNISASGKLFDMLSLATRQVFSSLEITAPYQSDNTTRIFMRDMGTSQRVTPVERLYAALPMFLYYNATLVKLLLVPLLEQQNTSLGAFPYASKDLGSLFPDVSGPNLISTEAIEQSGNMPSLHSLTPIFKRYVAAPWLLLLAQELGRVPDAAWAISSSGPIIVDDGSDATNSTNLAVKGILAIQAMAEISQLVGESDDSQHSAELTSNPRYSPALGGLFAPFLPQMRSGTVTVSPPSYSITSTSASGSGSLDVGAIAGGVVGGVVGLIALAGLGLWLLRRRRYRRNADLLDNNCTRTEPTPFDAAPAFTAQAPGVILTEKQRRELELPREEIPVLPSTGSSSAMPVAEPPSGSTTVPTTANA
ncbi:uncharacterized protein B0H18DRAFT_1211906 [Fomitopsis serialis]|uniref:uncharacterized protein n=1 Tax=Fomitopsis serialis TaxID=139415 RepID=UPI0020073676|nr:uncharacterized protein B0H18DRAFT_1211906 [Neoantrodia serialis]KAH9924482.1 hypothetical protein B0H18DRAFT_1211906 [Neoantrodia serialis]